MAIFDTKELLHTAQDKTGLRDFGSDDFRDGLENLVLGLNNAPNLREDRIGNVRDVLLRFLVNRLWTAHDFHQYPEILDQQLQQPLCICSLPRTGTTKLQRLLGSIGKFQHLLYWHSHMPARVPGEKDGGRDFRILETKRYCDWEVKTSPEFEKAHIRRANEPEEETFMMEQTFRNSSLALEFSSPEYSNWLMSVDMGPAYDYLVLQLKYLQWQLTPGNPRPWILKSPTHMGMEDQLVRVFPQGQHFLFSHRDPKEIIPSLCHLVKASQQLYYQTEARDDELGELVLNWLVPPLQQHMLWRQRNPDTKVLDLSFNEITANSQATARTICNFLDLPLEASSVREIEKWDKENPRHRHGKAKTSLASFGLTPEQVDEAFAEYVAAFKDFF